MNRKFHILCHAVWGLAAIAGFAAVFMLLWNALLPQIFGIAAINFWQSLGLLALFAGLSKFTVLAAFLGMRGYRRNPIHEKWLKMSDEERREFIKKRRFGHGHDFFDPKEPEKKD